MKKLIALTLALVMLAAMAVPAMAADFVKDSSDAAPSTTITYGVGDSYTLTVPETIDFNTAGTDTSASSTPAVTVSLSKVRIAANASLKVSVASTTGDVTANDTFVNAKETNKAAWTLVDVNGISNPVAYWASSSSERPASGEDTNKIDTSVALFTVTASDGAEASSGSLTFYFHTYGTAQTGSFKDVLTFTVSA